jgi:hypothetical protein
LAVLATPGAGKTHLLDEITLLEMDNVTLLLATFNSFMTEAMPLADTPDGESLLVARLAFTYFVDGALAKPHRNTWPLFRARVVQSSVTLAMLLTTVQKLEKTVRCTHRRVRSCVFHPEVGGIQVFSIFGTQRKFWW